MTWLAPVLGLLVFRLVDVKPAVTLYAIVIGLALLLGTCSSRLGSRSKRP